MIGQTFKEYSSFFSCATERNFPYPYQSTIADMPELPQLLHIPTGAGKTAAVVLGWLWRRFWKDETIREQTPRRLVYCLPMRSLVVQIETEIRKWINNLSLQNRVGVHILMGGLHPDKWDESPEVESIIIGTQDMLLSRALNRGYAMSRYRWPVDFALLNNDCLWVLDEIQLMGSGLASTTQLQGFRNRLGVYGVCQSIWMSATLRTDWLQSPDFRIPEHDTQPITLKTADLQNPDLARRLEAPKKIAQSPVPAEPKKHSNLASLILEHHKPDCITLVVVNTVDRAVSLYEQIEKHIKNESEQTKPRKKQGRKGNQESKEELHSDESQPIKQMPELLLLHSRFRPMDRISITDRLSGAIPPGGRIIVSTQVIEAGIDALGGKPIPGQKSKTTKLSARHLFTELAPWSSLVQRFGRCNRAGEYEDAEIHWLDVPEKLAPPYQWTELKNARQALLEITGASPKQLQDFIVGLPLTRSQELFPYQPERIIREHDFHGLFSTEPDLAGGFTDISGFIRDADPQPDLFVFWRDWQQKSGIPEDITPHRDELCRIASYKLQEFLKTTKGVAYEWNEEEEAWETCYPGQLRPGMTVLLNATQGGYSEVLGWTGEPTHRPTKLLTLETQKESRQRDNQSVSIWLPLIDHLFDAQEEAKSLTASLGLVDSPEGRAIIQAALWHDVGKIHDRWQGSIKAVAPKESKGPWAKFANDTQKKFAPGVRHEAASALAAWLHWQANDPAWSALAVYLIASHHGKVRTVLRSIDEGDDVFGVKQNDPLSPLQDFFEKPLKLDLSPRLFGAGGEWDSNRNQFVLKSPSWVSVVSELLGPELATDPHPRDALPQDEPAGLGPFKLAFYEMLIRIADWRASSNPGKAKQSAQSAVVTQPAEPGALTSQRATPAKSSTIPLTPDEGEGNE